MKKCIFDYKHVQGVRAVALLKNGKEAGKIIANFSDNPMGSVCTATVWIYGLDIEPGTGKAGGGGYDKFSAAVHIALKKMNLLPEHETLSKFTFKKSNVKLNGKIPVYSGSGNVKQAFEAAGYQYIEVC